MPGGKKLKGEVIIVILEDEPEVKKRRAKSRGGIMALSGV